MQLRVLSSDAARVASWTTRRVGKLTVIRESINWTTILKNIVCARVPEIGTELVTTGHSWYYHIGIQNDSFIAIQRLSMR